MLFFTQCSPADASVSKQISKLYALKSRFTQNPLAFSSDDLAEFRSVLYDVGQAELGFAKTAMFITQINAYDITNLLK